VRVLFSSTFGHGHVFPMVPLARAFIAGGNQVLWAVNGGGVGLVSDAGIDVVEAGLTGKRLQARLLELQAAADLIRPQERAAYMFPTMFGETLSPPMLVDLLALAKDWQPDLLVHENGELAAPLVGAVLGVRCVTHAFGGGVPEEFMAEAAKRLAPLWRQYDQEPQPHAGAFDGPYLDICPASVQTVPLDHVKTRLRLRPVPYGGEATEPGPAVLEDGARPLVYLTIGTVRAHAAKLAAAVAGIANLDVRLLVTVGPKGDPSALGPQPSHVTVKHFVPQTQVLPHAAVVVSHGGSGTFLGALGYGIPQVCLPQGADQFRNAEGGLRSGAALAVPPDEASPEAVAAAVRRVLSQGSFRTAAEAVAREIAAMPSPDQVVEELRS
jgi:UDP:flavonoid glycosyltransferase YjiC (YdhE family)